MCMTLWTYFLIFAAAIVYYVCGLKEYIVYWIEFSKN
jgi:hypothetical protein